MKSKSSPPGDFARNAVAAHLLQITCLNCLTVIGTASSERAVAILEKAHQCKAAR